MWLSCYHEAMVLYFWKWSLVNLTSVQWLLAEPPAGSDDRNKRTHHVSCAARLHSAGLITGQNQSTFPFPHDCSYLSRFQRKKMSQLTTLTATHTDTLLVVIFYVLWSTSIILYKYFSLQAVLWLIIISRRPLNWSGSLINSSFSTSDIRFCTLSLRQADGWSGKSEMSTKKHTTGTTDSDSYLYLLIPYKKTEKHSHTRVTS